MQEIKSNIEKLEKALASPATPENLKGKLRDKLEQLKTELASVEQAQAEATKAKEVVVKVEKEEAPKIEVAKAKKEAIAAERKVSEKKAKAKRAVKSASPLLKDLRKIAPKSQTRGRSGASILEDAQRKAKKPGKRVSAEGETYWESRPNRSDVSRKRPYLEKGGEVEKKEGVEEEKKIEEAIAEIPKGELLVIIEANNHPLEHHFVKTLREASDKVKAYISKHKVSSKDWVDAAVVDKGGKHVAMVSYNGKVWDGEEIEEIDVEYKRGGQLPAQGHHYTVERDEERIAKPVGWRYTTEGARRLGVKLMSKPSEEHIERYKDKEFTKQGIKHRYLYDEKRRDKSDVTRHTPHLAQGGEIPSYVGSGDNINVFGYQTSNFDICAKATAAFLAAIDKIEEEYVDTVMGKQLSENLSECAKYIDDIFSIEKETLGGHVQNGEFEHVLFHLEKASVYNYKSGMLIDLSFTHQHIIELADRLIPQVNALDYEDVAELDENEKFTKYFFTGQGSGKDPDYAGKTNEAGDQATGQYKIEGGRTHFEYAGADGLYYKDEIPKGETVVVEPVVEPVAEEPIAEPVIETPEVVVEPTPEPIKELPILKRGGKIKKHSKPTL